jgi:hypothetical protein
MVLLNVITPEEQEVFNRDGLPEDACQKYTKRALQSTQLYKDLPRHIGKSRWSKETLCRHLRRDDPFSMVGNRNIMLKDRRSFRSHHIPLDVCRQYKKGTLLAESEAVKTLVREFPSTKSLPRQTLCALVEKRRADLEHQNATLLGLHIDREQQNNEITVLRDDLEQQNDKIMDLHMELEHQNDEMMSLHNDITQRNNQIVGLHNDIRQRNDEIMGLGRHLNEVNRHLLYHDHVKFVEMYKFNQRRMKRLHQDSVLLESTETGTITRNLKPIEKSLNRGRHNKGLFVFTNQLKQITSTMVKKITEPPLTRSRSRPPHTMLFEVEIARELRDNVVMAGHAPGFMLSSPDVSRRVYIRDSFCPLCHTEYTFDKIEKTYSCLNTKCRNQSKISDIVTIKGRYLFIEKCGDMHLERFLVHFQQRYNNYNISGRLRGIMFEVFWSIYAAQMYVPGFRHNDLKLDNIMVRTESMLQRQYHYTSFQGIPKVKKCNQPEMPIIIDFGISSSILTRQDQDFSDTERDAGCRRTRDYAYDVFFFCLVLKIHLKKHRMTVDTGIMNFLEKITGRIDKIIRPDHTPEKLRQSHPSYASWMNNRHFIRDVILDDEIFSILGRKDSSPISGMWTIDDPPETFHPEFWSKP